MKQSFLIFLLSAMSFTSCTSSQINKALNDILETGANTPVTEGEMQAGLREALINGITNGANVVSKTDGYFKNPKIKIPWPQDVQKVQNTLRDIGLGNEVDKVVLSLNRAAEDAALQAKPIFINAIKQMTFQDALGIIKGNQSAATDYLKRTTSTQLQQAFSPVIKNSLNKVNATKYWGDIMTQYNKIPLVKPVNTDLTAYVTDKAIDGLFTMVAQEELKIRKDPLARTTELLKKVFKLQDN